MEKSKLGNNGYAVDLADNANLVEEFEVNMIQQRLPGYTQPVLVMKGEAFVGLFIPLTSEDVMRAVLGENLPLGLNPSSTGLEMVRAFFNRQNNDIQDVVRRGETTQTE